MKREYFQATSPSTRCASESLAHLTGPAQVIRQGIMRLTNGLRGTVGLDGPPIGLRWGASHHFAHVVDRLSSRGGP